ncbi:MAG: PHP domain-containing protein, partial [Firmicutes bacterium]|nr:PHP domain-containing protein [Bacillota bacterium]
MRIAADYHTHTIHSHGTGTVLDNLKAAAAKGLKEVAISDHGPANLFGIGTKGIDTFRQIRAEMEAAAQLVPNVRGLLGVEANILSVDGRLDISEEDLEIFDVVQAGLHILVNPGSLRDGLQLTLPNVVGRYFKRTKVAMRDRNTQAVIAALHRYPIDILTHPGLRVDIDTKAIAYHCAQRGTLMVINSSH